MEIHLTESKFRYMLTEMVKQVLLEAKNDNSYYDIMKRLKKYIKGIPNVDNNLPSIIGNLFNDEHRFTTQSLDWKKLRDGVTQIPLTNGKFISVSDLPDGDYFVTNNINGKTEYKVIRKRAQNYQEVGLSDMFINQMIGECNLKSFDPGECIKVNDFPGLYYDYGIIRMYIDAYCSGVDNRAALVGAIVPFLQENPDYCKTYANRNGITIEEWKEWIDNTATLRELYDVMRADITAYNQDLADQTSHYGNQIDPSLEYTIYSIDTPKMAKDPKFQQYTDWCVTTNERMYKQYTQEFGKFYFLLQKGYDNEELFPRVPGDEAPLDKYGLSMLAICVSPEGVITHITSRWNHANNGTDKIMTYKELADYLQADPKKLFPPRSQEELRMMGYLTFQDAVTEVQKNRRTLKGAKITILPNNVKLYNFTKQHKYIVVLADNTICMNDWFDNAYIVPDNQTNSNIIITQKTVHGNKSNIINSEGTGLVWDKPLAEWFDGVSDITNFPYFKVLKNDEDGENGKYNFLSKDGSHFLSSIWGDIKYSHIYKESLSIVVEHNGERRENVFNPDSNSWVFNEDIETWAEYVDVLGNNYVKVGEVDHNIKGFRDNVRWNVLDLNTNQLIWDKPQEEWFKNINNYSEGVVIVENYYEFGRLLWKRNYLNLETGKLLWDKPLQEWFDKAEGIHEGIGVVGLYWGNWVSKYNFIKKDGTGLLWNKPIDEWLDGARDCKNGYALIEYKGKMNWISSDGKRYLWNKPYKQWFDVCSRNFINNYSCVCIKTEHGKKYNYLHQNGRNFLWNKPLDEWFDRAYDIEQTYGVGWVEFKQGEGTLYNWIKADGSGFLWDKPVNEWFDLANKRELWNTNRLCLIRYKNKYNWIKLDGSGFVWDKPVNEWFDDAESLKDCYGKIVFYPEKNNYNERRANLIKLDGSGFVWNKPIEYWPNTLWGSNKKFTEVSFPLHNSIHDKYYLLGYNGKLYDRVTKRVIPQDDVDWLMYELGKVRGVIPISELDEYIDRLVQNYLK